MGATSFNLRFKVLLIAGLCSLLAGCGNSDPPPPKTETLKRLATEVYMRIAEQPLRLPFAALQDYAYKNVSFSLDRARDLNPAHDTARALLASNSTNPLALDKIRVEVFDYGSINEQMAYKAMCPLFAREWERSVCKDYQPAVLLGLPSKSFLIVNLSQALSNQDSGGINCVEGTNITADLLPKQNGDIAIVCRQNNIHQSGPGQYQGAIRIHGDLGVLWSISDNHFGRESLDSKVRREGKALETFLEHALGTQEDFARLHADMCQLRRPGAYENAAHDDCAK